MPHCTGRPLVEIGIGILIGVFITVSVMWAMKKGRKENTGDKDDEATASWRPR